jgi:hypothetical protein
MTTPNPTPNTIDRRAVLEAIESNFTAYTANEICRVIAALPAVMPQVDEAQARAFDALNSPEERARHSWPQMMNEPPMFPELDNTPDAPQPAPDVADVLWSLRALTASLGGATDAGICQRAHDALTTLDAQLNAAKEAHEQAQVQLAGCLIAAEGGTTDTAKQGDYGWSLAYQCTLDLQAQLAQERARSERAEGRESQANKRVDAITLEVEQWRADMACAAGENMVEMPKPNTTSARLLAATRILKDERDAALTRAADAEKALAEALKSLEWGHAEMKGRPPQHWLDSLEAIRRVLLGGAGNLSVTYGADPEAATTKEVNVDATHR